MSDATRASILCGRLHDFSDRLADLLRLNKIGCPLVTPGPRPEDAFRYCPPSRGRQGIFFKQYSSPRFLQTGNHHHLIEYTAQTGEPFVLRPTLGDRLHAVGKHLAAYWRNRFYTWSVIPLD